MTDGTKMVTTSPAPLRILIIDDDLEDQEIVEWCLIGTSRRSYEFLKAESGEKGLALYHSARPDCVILDYRLPDMDGLTFLTALEDRKDIVSVPVIMMTGYGNEAIVTEAIQAGADDYIPKGALSTKSLERAIDNAVEKYQLRATLQEQYRILQETNQELLHRREEIQCFYHTLCHELKTPLTVIHMFTSIVLDELAGPLTDDQRQYLTISKDSCDQITFGLNELLDITRLDTGKFRINPCPASIGTVVSQVVTSMMPAAEDKRIQLEQAIETDMADAYFDTQRISMVVANLLTNALKFTPEGGEIMVKVGNHPQDPTSVLVAVRDTGCGIESEYLDLIFERLYQVQPEGAISEGGLGLGLYICQEIVKLHGGEIQVESIPKKGSTFSFTLPKYITH